MANELSLSINMNFSKGGAKYSRAESISVDVTGESYKSQIQLIGTSQELLVGGSDMGDKHYVFMKNLDDTNFVEVGLSASYPIKLLPGDIALFPATPSAATLYAKADTASCYVEYAMVEL